MQTKRFDIEGRKVILHSDGAICTTASDMLHSEVFGRVVSAYCGVIRKRDNTAFRTVLPICKKSGEWDDIIRLLCLLADQRLEEIVETEPRWKYLLEGPSRTGLHEFVEGLYDYWRSFDRFMVLHSEPGKSSFDRRPYRSFNKTIEELTHIVRATYRDICENITGDHPRIYRQVFAGCDVGLIAVQKPANIPARYKEALDRVPFIRHVWIAPPMIIDPPTNTRTGQFQKTDRNPLDGIAIDPTKWLCYPAQVGPVVVFVFFHQRFIELGCSLANLFDLATDEQIKAGPSAIYCFGVDPGHMESFGKLPTVFHEDAESDVLLAAVPGEDRFGYFGYLKKMILTLHNIVMMKRQRMPYHGAMIRISLKNGRNANVVIIGDTATGKSESLEAFRMLGLEYIRELRIIADDMGSFEVHDGQVYGYGTETGAFIRLDDLQQGYAFEQIDRAIIMSPQKVNARVVLPVTTLAEVLRGYQVDYLLYANNYEEIDDEHPIIEKFQTADRALAVFGEGAAMAKGTTSATGLVHSYFANIFGPPQYKDLHSGLARKVFDAAFGSGVFVGELRTRLGVKGLEGEGPQAAAKALFELIAQG